MTALESLRPILSILPEVPKAKRIVGFREKLVWTVIVLTIYLAFTQIPISYCKGTTGSIFAFIFDNFCC